MKMLGVFIILLRLNKWNIWRRTKRSKSKKNNPKAKSSRRKREYRNILILIKNNNKLIQIKCCFWRIKIKMEKLKSLPAKRKNKSQSSNNHWYKIQHPKISCRSLQKYPKQSNRVYRKLQRRKKIAKKLIKKTIRKQRKKMILRMKLRHKPRKYNRKSRKSK